MARVLKLRHVTHVKEIQAQGSNVLDTAVIIKNKLHIFLFRNNMNYTNVPSSFR